jgi:hypothetical protein
VSESWPNRSLRSAVCGVNVPRRIAMPASTLQALRTTRSRRRPSIRESQPVRELCPRRHTVAARPTRLRDSDRRSAAETRCHFVELRAYGPELHLSLEL